jgi:hypothetical protein
MMGQKGFGELAMGETKTNPISHIKKSVMTSVRT